MKKKKIDLYWADNIRKPLIMIVFFKIEIAYIYIEKISRAVPATKNLFYPEISFIIPIFTPIHMKVCIPKLEFLNFVLNDSP